MLTESQKTDNARNEIEQEARKRKARCTIDLPSKLDDKLDAVAESSGLTKSEVLRRALEYFLKSREYRTNGYDTGAFKENSEGAIRLVSFDIPLDME